jgi:hypothetical protein
MKILEHIESHIVKLNDGSTWQIFPGDIDQTLKWLPTTELRLFESDRRGHAPARSNVKRYLCGKETAARFNREAIIQIGCGTRRAIRNRSHLGCECFSGYWSSFDQGQL